MSFRSTPRTESQLRALYGALLSRDDRFDEFKRLVSRYTAENDDAETSAARELRAALNARIREWVGTFDGLSVVETMQWRALLCDEAGLIAAATGPTC